MRIVVTGGAGFVGSNLAKELDKEHDVIVIDDFSNADFTNLKGFKGSVFAYDLRVFDWENFFMNEKIDAIFHQAAITDTTVMDQKKMVEVNTNTFKSILDYAIAHRIKVIYASSAAVYGNGKSPMMEDQELAPLNIYGFSKLAMDNLAMQYMKTHRDLSIAGLRYYNVFGPGEAHKNKFASMIWQLSLQMKAGKNPRIFKQGEQTRDHIYVKDVVLANIKMLSFNGSGIFNCGTGVETSFNDIISHLNEVLGTSHKPEYIDNPYSFFQTRTCADITKISDAVNFKPNFSVKDGIIDYFKAIE